MPKTYSINFLSSAFEEAEPMETNVQCGLDGDNFTDYTVGSEPGFVSQHGNYSFAGERRDPAKASIPLRGLH